jgi:hypothetical protein
VRAVIGNGVRFVFFFGPRQIKGEHSKEKKNAAAD